MVFHFKSRLERRVNAGASFSSRLCEDFVGRHAGLFDRQLDWLPSRMRRKIDKRAAFFAAAAPVLSA